MSARDSRLVGVRALLERYRPIDGEEALHHARMVALLEGEAPFSRRSFCPGHFTASAFVVSPDGGELLLIRHRKLGRWLQPGGHIDDADPDALFAARRELEEEAALASVHLHPAFDGLFDVDVHVIPARADEPSHEHFDLRFAFVAERAASARRTDEVDGLKWLPLERVGADESDASVARAAKKLLEKRP